VREPTVGVILGAGCRLQQDRGGCAERGQAEARGGASCGRGHHHIGGRRSDACAGPPDSSMQGMRAGMRHEAMRGNSAGPLSLQSLQNCTPS
jgi:hypothetical protein